MKGTFYDEMNEGGVNNPHSASLLLEVGGCCLFYQFLLKSLVPPFLLGPTLLLTVYDKDEEEIE